MTLENTSGSSKLLLLDLIHLAGVELTDFKIHLATASSSSPLDAYFKGQFEVWQEYQNKQNFSAKRILSLIQLSGSDWLFAGVWDVHGCERKEDGPKTWFIYDTTVVPGLDHLVGRVIVSYPRTFRAAYVWGSTYGKELIAKEIRPVPLSIGEFPGYSRVALPFERLQTIIVQSAKSWQGALSAVGGIYVIADTKTGKLYVGSAYGEGGFWQRWCSYAACGHGGNKELAELLRAEGPEYCMGFKFSILEIMDLKENVDYAIERENHWKEALLTRSFGLNSN